MSCHPLNKSSHLLLFMSPISFSLRGAGIIPYCATFTIFTDYMRGAIRIAALSQAGTIFVTTHDSIAAPGPSKSSFFLSDVCILF